MEAELSNRLKSIHAYVRDLISCGHLSSQEENMMLKIRQMCLGNVVYSNGVTKIRELAAK